MKKSKGIISKNSSILIYIVTAFILVTLIIMISGCSAADFAGKDSIDNLSFSHDGKKVVFDRCRDEGCQIQVYDLERGELAAYQSPENERWSMRVLEGHPIMFPSREKKYF